MRILVFVSLALLPNALGAQSLRSAPSTRATAVATLNPPREASQAGAQPVTISIDYGQPHARGRTVAGALEAELDTIWRMGANEATALTTGVDLVIGNLTVPKGEYTLYARTSRTGQWQLIVSKKTKQWGTDYDPSMDLGRVPLRSRTLSTPLESLTMWLIPAAEGAPRGELRFAWGTREFSADWRVR
jgi:hypothetical protein